MWAQPAPCLPLDHGRHAQPIYGRYVPERTLLRYPNGLPAVQYARKVHQTIQLRSLAREPRIEPQSS